jgi:hypothetical protein
MTIDDFLSRERHERELAWRAILRAERHLAIAEAAADLAALMTDYGVESLDALPPQAEAEKARRLATLDAFEGPRTPVTANRQQQTSRYYRTTAAMAGALVGVSARSVYRAQRIAKHAPDLMPDIKSGALTLNQAERILNDRLAAERRRERPMPRAER